MSKHVKDAASLAAGIVLGLFVIPGIIFIDSVVVPWWESGEVPPFTADESQAEAEAKWMLHNAREAVQRSVSHVGEVPIALAGTHPEGTCGLPAEELTGRHYVLVNGIDILPDGRLQVVAVPLIGNYPLMRLHFYPEDSLGEVVAEPHPVGEFR